MLWLIWIVLMVCVPLFCGLEVWLQMRQEPSERGGGQDEAPAR